MDVDHGGADPVVHAQLTRIARSTGLVMADLATLADLLAAGRGSETPGELTPQEFDFLAHHLGRIGLAGAQLLAEDLERTGGREGSDWPDDAPPRPERSRPH